MPQRSFALFLFIAALFGLCAALSARPEDESLAEQQAQPEKAPTLKKIFLPKNPVAAAYMLRRVPNSELVLVERSEPIYAAMLTRAGIEKKYRQEAAAGLAQLRQTDALTEVLGGIQEVGQSAPEEAASPLYDLAQLVSSSSTQDLAAKRPELEQLAAGAENPVARQIGYMGMMLADGDGERVWNEAKQARGGLQDAAAAVSLLSDLALRKSMHPRLAALIQMWDSEPAIDEATIRAAIAAIVTVPGRETENFRLLSDLLQRGVQPLAVIKALMQIPKSRWDKDQAPALLDHIVALAENVPAKQRTEADFLNTIQLGGELASLLPEQEADRIRAKLDGLGVRVIVLRAVPHKMTYDRKAVAVEAGKPVEFVFENTDIMPHNLVIVKPGSLAEVGLLAEKMQTDPDALEKHFIPDSDQILFHTKMLQPRERARLSITAPATPGEYQYVCTFPGHWRRMFGTLHVVADLQKFLAEHELPDAEEIAEQRPFVKEWTYQDLANELENLSHGRSFEQGKAMFRAGSCFSCHKIEETIGGEVGPNLRDVAKRFKAHEILAEVLEPSKRINEKFKSYSIETVKGRLITGLVVSQDENEVRLMVNPLASCEPTIVPRDEIDFMEAARISAMPKGLLNTLNKEEILDLLAYLVANGDPSHPAFE